MKNASYETDLTDAQWQLLETILPAAKKRGRPRTSLRAVCHAIFYIAKAGCPWRLLTLQTAHTYIKALLKNTRVAKYLKGKHAEIGTEFENLAAAEPV